MAIARILLWVGNSLLLVAFMLWLTAICGVFLGDVKYAQRFVGLGLVVGLFGIILYVSTNKIPAKETANDALLFLAIFWVCLPVILSIPYMLTDTVQSIPQAYFEAVSAITTTGASTLVAEDLPKILHIWRSLLQWVGGTAAATFAVIILAALNLRGTGVHRSMLFTLKKGELFQRLIGIGRVIAGIYLAISVMCFIGLVMSGTSIFEALCLSMTAVSTGGLTPTHNVLASYVNPFGIFALMLTCALGAFNVAIIWDMIRLRSLDAVKALMADVEHRAFFAVTIILIIIGAIYTDFSHIFSVVAEAVFFMSSTGFDYHVINLDVVPSIILIAAALIGGAALSTAGGVKLIRFILLFRHLGTDMNRLSHPSRVVPVIFRGHTLNDEAFLSIWMYFFGYTVIFALGIMALALFNLEFDIAVATSAAFISNMGPLLDATLPMTSYADFSTSQLMVGVTLMIIGRVEVLAVLALLQPKLWRE